MASDAMHRAAARLNLYIGPIQDEVEQAMQAGIPGEDIIDAVRQIVEMMEEMLPLPGEGSVPERTVTVGPPPPPMEERSDSLGRKGK